MSLEKVKILILGLKSSGKTSIVYSLQKKINLLNFVNLKPTRGINKIDFEEGDTKFYIWDFGGQESYRKDYLERMDRYFNEAKKFIYVIDIQEQELYDNSLGFLEDIILILKNKELYVSISIFLHKYDPDLEIEEEIPINLVKKIEALIPKEFKYKIFKTSIYTVFRKLPFS
ncbi:hypothetical protein LCGC14_0834280 [marine sediment metagenome]|uniref:GTP-binding protein n=1 Tax=marine sediment metagenome TaxID=412755 RepID=A0A0F9PF42_9ZZZZ